MRCKKKTPKKLLQNTLEKISKTPLESSHSHALDCSVASKQATWICWPQRLVSGKVIAASPRHVKCHHLHLHATGWPKRRRHAARPHSKGAQVLADHCSPGHCCFHSEAIGISGELSLKCLSYGMPHLSPANGIVSLFPVYSAGSYWSPHCLLLQFLRGGFHMPQAFFLAGLASPSPSPGRCPTESTQIRRNTESAGEVKAVTINIVNPCTSI